MVRRSKFSYSNDAIKGNRWKLPRKLARHEQWVEAILPADAEAGKVESETNRHPLWAMGLVVVVALVILAARMFVLQISDGKQNLSYADNQRIRQAVIRAPRGIIYDRNHTVIARNESNYDVTVTPDQLPATEAERQALIQKVAAAINQPASAIAKVAEADLTSSQPELVASNLSRDQALLFEQRQEDFPMFSLDVNPIRQYLDNSTLSQTIGYTGRISPDELTANPTYLPTDYIGKEGIEEEYENLLRGVDGSQQTEVDVTGKPVKVLANQPATPGDNLVLSIDMGLEQRLAQALQEQLNIAKAAGVTTQQASGVAVDPRNGDVLALVSLPSYDNNLFAKGISQADFSKLASNPDQPLYNKPVSGAYPTGSIIKPLIATAALQEHVVTPTTTVNDTGQLTIPNPYDPTHPFIQRSYEPGGFGPLDITDAIRLSSNVFFYTMGGGFGNLVGLGVDRLTRYYGYYGLGARPGIDLPDQTAGVLPNPAWKEKTLGQPWYLADTYNISVGQGELHVSPLQMADAIAAIANGGTLYKPHLVTQILDDQNRVVKTIKPEVIRKIPVSSQNFAIVQNAMREVVDTPGGTACCKIEKEVPVHVAAKTGTAETGGFTGTQLPHAWFEAYAPYESPQIVIVAMIANSGEGAVYAAPAVRETLDWYFAQPRP